MRNVTRRAGTLPLLLGASFALLFPSSPSCADGPRGGSGSTPETSAVILYREADFTGKFEIFFYDEGTLGDNYIANDEVSSVQLVGNATCTLYEDEFYGGTSIGIAESMNIPEELDDALSSIRVHGANYSGIILYTMANFEGDSDLFIVDDNNLEDNRSGSRPDNYDLNDQVSSVRLIGEGISADLYVDKDFQNHCAYVTADIYDLEGQGCNDKISSIRVYGFQHSGVVLYEDTDFLGKSEVFIADDREFCYEWDYTWPPFGCVVSDWIGENRVSSVRLLGGATSTLYEDVDFGGYAEEMTVSGNVSSAIHDKTSSIRVDLPDPQAPAWGIAQEAEASIHGDATIALSGTGNALFLLFLPAGAIIAPRLWRRKRPSSMFGIAPSSAEMQAPTSCEGTRGSRFRPKKKARGEGSYKPSPRA